MQKTQQLLNDYVLSSIQKNNKRIINNSYANCSMPILTNANELSFQTPQKKIFSKNVDQSLFNTKSTLCNKSANTPLKKLKVPLFSPKCRRIDIKDEPKSIDSLQMKIKELPKSQKYLEKLQKKTSQVYEKRNRQLQQINKKITSCKNLLTNHLTLKKTPHLQKSISSPATLCKNMKSNLNKTINYQFQGEQIPLIDQFKFVKNLGEGKFGKVCLVIHKKTGFVAALKVLKKSFLVSSMMIKQLIHQIKIQSFIDHPNIVKLFCFFDDHENIYLLSEYLSDGHLYSYLQANPDLSEKQVSKIMINICSAVQQLHRNHIIHRDLKPENMILQSGVVKICDFGWSVNNNQSRMRQTCCGTPLYIAPQILLDSPYNEKADVWSLGILVYELITKKLPFDIKKQSDLINITKKRVMFPPRISQQAKQFIIMMLTKNPNQRASLQELLNAKFIKMHCNTPQFTTQ